MVGALMYLTASRPNIVHATCYYARYQAKPTEKHLTAVKRIFWYLKDSINMGLWYPNDTGFEPTAFLDSDHAGCLDSRKSTSGGIQFLGGDKLVSWLSKKQDCTSISQIMAFTLIKYLCIVTQRQPLPSRAIQSSISLADLFTKALSEDRFKYLVRWLDPLPAKRLRVDHPSLAFGTGGKTLASLRRTIPEGSFLLGTSPADVHTQVTVRSSRVADAPVYTVADTVTSSQGKTLVLPTSDMGGSSQPETSEESTDSFYETAVQNSEDAKRCNMDYDQLFEEFNVGEARHICLGSEVRSRTEHELELKEKLRVKYDARGVLLGEKDTEIARLKSLVKEKETESAEVLRLRDQVSVVAADKFLLSAEVSALKSAILQKDTDISLLDSRASYLKSALDDSQAACGEARNLISSLSSERDRLASEVSTLHSAFRDFKEKMEAQQEAQSPEYQGILGHALGRAVDYLHT
ncbi:hypothetical protein Tco_1399048 [Tanacetum coccineum]